MGYKKMMLSFLRLLVENRGIEVEPIVIIEVKDSEVKIMDVDIKVNELFDREYFLNHMRVNGMGFDVLDFYMEEAFELMEEVKKNVNQPVQIMLKIEEDLIRDKYFISWIKYIKDICNDFNIKPSDIIIEVKSSKDEKSEINTYGEMKGIEKIREYGFRIAISSTNKITEQLKGKYIEIIDANEVDIMAYKNKQVPNKNREILIRGKKDISNLEGVEYDYFEIQEKL